MQSAQCHPAMGKRYKPGRRQRLQRRNAPLSERWNFRQYRVASSMQRATSAAADFLLDICHHGDGDESAGQVLRHPRSLARTRAQLILQNRRAARRSSSAGSTGARRSNKWTAEMTQDISAGSTAPNKSMPKVQMKMTLAQTSWHKRCCSSPDYFLCRVMARRTVLHLEVGRSALYVPELQLYVDSDETSAWRSRIRRAVGAARSRADELEATIADLRLLHRLGRTHLPDSRQTWLDEVLADHGWPMPVACQRR